MKGARPAGARPGRGGGAVRHQRELAARRARAPARERAWSTSDEPGLYRLGASAAAVEPSRDLVAGRSIARAPVERRLDRRRERRRAARRNDRAAAPSPSSASATCAATSPLRPDNLAGGIGATRDRLVRSSASTASADVFGMHDLTTATAQRATRLWDTAAIRLGYRRTIAELERSEHAASPPCRASSRWRSRSCSADARSARSCSTRACPIRWCRRAERRALIDALTRYDRAGRARWATLPA